MRKFLPLLLLTSTFCHAQDTLVFNTGEKVVVKIFAVKGDEVIYTIPPLDKQQSVSQSKLDYIMYEDGTRYTIQNEGVKQYNNDNPNRLNVGQIMISCCLGYPVYGLFFSPSLVSQDKFVQFFPSLGLIIDKVYGLRHTIGAGITYATFTVEPRRFAFTTTTYSITNITVRYKYFFVIRKKLKAYFGAAINYSVINDVVHFQSGNVPDNLTGPSLSIFVGFQWYISKVFAVHFEGEIGEPYLTAVGLSYKINTHKSEEKSK